MASKDFFVGIVGDNLSANELLGYPGGFNANYFCRWCKTIKMETQTDRFKRKENLRCISSYEFDLRLGIEKSAITEHCVWNRINDFHVYENNIPDVLHDGPKGPYAYDMGHITFHVVNLVKKTVKLSILNDRLSHQKLWPTFIIFLFLLAT